MSKKLQTATAFGRKVHKLYLVRPETIAISLIDGNIASKKGGRYYVEDEESARTFLDAKYKRQRDPDVIYLLEQRWSAEAWDWTAIGVFDSELLAIEAARQSALEAVDNTPVRWQRCTGVSTHNGDHIEGSFTCAAGITYFRIVSEIKNVLFSVQEDERIR